MSFENGVKQVEVTFGIPLKLGIEFTILINDIISRLSDLSHPCFPFIQLRDHFRQQRVASYIMNEMVVRQTQGKTTF